MAELTFKDYLEQQKHKNSGEKDFPVKFFKVEEGKPAVVRFFLSDNLDDGKLKLHTVHKVGEFPDTRTVSCIRNGSRDTCPFCRDEVGKRQTRAFVFLLNYEKDEDGNVVAVPCKWERSASQRADFMSTLNEYTNELGDLSDYIFKITRSGEGLDTKYTIMPFANQEKYPESVYVKDFSAFKDYGTTKDLNIWEYSKAEMESYCDTGEWPSKDEDLDLADDDEAVSKPAKRTFTAF